MFVLYEHASGYVLVHCEQTDDISELNANDYANFGQLVKLKAFQPFTSAAIALDNMNAISEGLVHADLKKFLVNNVPKGQSVGINDQRLLQVVKEELDMSVAGGDIVLEICRGVRMHIHQMIKPLTLAKEGGAQLGLSHSYSRTKVKFNVNRMDNMVIQAIALIDQLDKDINTFAMRVREWYGYHFPEMVRLVNDNYQYCQLIGLINIEIFAKKVISLADYRKKLQQYLSDKMSNVAPSLAALIGDVVGARLISHAGSLTKLAKYPASTVQILGAEKALFRALKTKGNTPKYGLLFHSTFIGRATAKNKGRISRFLANKCSIASRIDAFSEAPNNIFGDKLKEQVEERLKMYEDGDVPRKNIDVMKEAMQAVKAAQPEDEQTVAATKRKIEAVDEVDTSETPSKKKKKKKDKVKEEPSEEVSEEVTEETPKKKKKKKKAKEEASEETVTEEASVEPETDSTEVKKKKKKKKAKEEPSEEAEPVTEEAEPVTEETSQEVDSSEKKKKKKKKKKAEEE